MKGRIVMKGMKEDGQWRYYLGEREVGQAEYEEHFPDKPMAANGRCSLQGWSRPIWSDAMAIHPEQIPEAMERNKRAGVFVEYDRTDGRPKLTSREQRRKLMELEGVHDNQGGYGDDHKPNVRVKPKKKLSEAFIEEGVKMNVEEFTKDARKKFTGK